MTEQELISRARQGDQDAFARLVEAHQKRVYNQALRMVGDAGDAQDVAQEAFLNAWRGLAAFQGESTFATWLHRLTANAAIDHLRRRKARGTEGQRSLDEEDGGPEPQDPAPGPEEALAQRERRAALNRALEQLSPEHRQALELRVLDGLSYEEMGQLLALPPGTVRSRLARARLALKKILAQDGNFSGFLPSMETKERGGRQP
jgi:RNA polymerase sigma-70 factor (ECF subfamily)